MRIIKLMPDYFCYPLWEASPGLFGNIDPKTLPISHALQTQLLNWAKAFDDTLDMSDPGNAGFKDAKAAVDFNQEGSDLAKQLRIELGDEFAIIDKYERKPCN
jgi:hypothetical protein